MNDTKLLMHVLGCVAMLLAAISPVPGAAQEQTLQTMIYDPGQLKPVDSVLND